MIIAARSDENSDRPGRTVNFAAGRTMRQFEGLQDVRRM
jgi:hypothetical protein